jgi:adenylate kinase
MLKVEINGKEGITKVEANGVLPELMADVTILLNAMYEGISEKEKQNFKNCIKDLAEKELYAKSNEEIDKLVKEEKNKVKEELKKELKDLLKDLFGDK